MKLKHETFSKRCQSSYLFLASRQAWPKILGGVSMFGGKFPPKGPWIKHCWMPNQQCQSTEEKQADQLIELRFYIPSDTNWLFRRRSSQPISWPRTEKLNIAQHKQTRINNKTYHNTKQTQKLKPCSVAFYPLWPGNGTGLFLRK